MNTSLLTGEAPRVLPPFWGRPRKQTQTSSAGRKDPEIFQHPAFELIPTKCLQVWVRPDDSTVGIWHRTLVASRSQSHRTWNHHVTAEIWNFLLGLKATEGYRRREWVLPDAAPGHPLRIPIACFARFVRSRRRLVSPHRNHETPLQSW